jgi:hypothetical protein
MCERSSGAGSCRAHGLFDYCRVLRVVARRENCSNRRGVDDSSLMLVGRFKREIGEKVFTQPLAHKWKSGVATMLWFWCTLGLLKARKKGTGPLFRSEKNKQALVAKARRDVTCPLGESAEQVAQHHP